MSTRTDSAAHAETELRIIAVGDLSFNGGYTRVLERQGPAAPFRRVLPHWEGADLRLGNFESAVTSAPRVVPSRLVLRAAPIAVASLKAAGFDYLSLANNHAMDFGPEGLAETCARLKDAGIAFGGAGADDSSARAPVVLHRREQSIGLLSYSQSPFGFAAGSTPGTAEFRLDDCLEEIRALRPRVNWLILQIHWGEEMSQLPSPEQCDWARRLVEAGADLVLGHHPHVLQPCETIDGTPVFYSLGNFLFSEMYWRGTGAQSERFVAKLTLGPLARRTGWAEIRLRKCAAPTRWSFHPATIGCDLAVAPGGDREKRQWQALNDRIGQCDNPSELDAERQRAATRRHYQYSGRPLHRRVKLHLFARGLLPGAIEGV